MDRKDTAERKYERSLLSLKQQDILPVTKSGHLYELLVCVGGSYRKSSRFVE